MTRSLSFIIIPVVRAARSPGWSMACRCRVNPARSPSGKELNRRKMRSSRRYRCDRGTMPCAVTLIVSTDCPVASRPSPGSRFMAAGDPVPGVKGDEPDANEAPPSDALCPRHTFGIRRHKAAAMRGHKATRPALLTLARPRMTRGTDGMELTFMVLCSSARQ